MLMHRNLSSNNLYDLINRTLIYLTKIVNIISVLIENDKYNIKK